MMEERVSGHAVAEGCAGDDGHIQKARVAQKPPKLRLLRQRIVERGTVCAVSGVNEDHGHSGFPTVVEICDQRLIIRRLLRLIGRLGQHQDPQFFRSRIRLCQAEEVKMLLHNGGQGLIVIIAGRLVLRAAVIAHTHIRPLPADLIQVQPGDGLEGQVIHPGEEGIPLPQEAAQIGNFVFLDTVLHGGVVNADENVEILISGPGHRLQHLIREAQLPGAGGQIFRHLPLLQVKFRQVQHRAVGGQSVIPLNVGNGQIVPLQHRAARHAIGAQGVITLQIPVVISHRGGQAHDTLQQPDLVVRIRRQSRQQVVQQGLLRYGGAVGEGDGL